VQFMLTELAKGPEVVVAAHQPLATLFSDSPPGLTRRGAEVASAAEAAAHRQPPFRVDLLALTRLLRADQLPES